jgi:UDP-2-acetamido-2,6-beta-L-arabino-hexul-4-ose reductase
MGAERPVIAVTGANGFLGSNLVLRLKERGHDVHSITRETSRGEAERELTSASVIFHLAGANRPKAEAEYYETNRDLTAWLADAVASAGRKPLIIYSSSAKASGAGIYGASKRAGEKVLLELAERGLATVSIWRLPNLCGKWARPYCNSVVATFCHCAARGEPVPIDDPNSPVSLLYVDDLVDQWLHLIADPPQASAFTQARNVHRTTVGEIAELISAFAEARSHGVVGEVGTGLARALYASFIAALPTEDASYPLQARKDARGTFVEVLKTPASGQFSYFTAHPGVTRGGHYHHSKVEKFLVAHGTGRFRFRHVLSGEAFELTSSAGEPRMIEAIPGWTHDVTNVGNDELVVLAWANEQFDPERPDTYPLPL